MASLIRTNYEDDSIKYIFINDGSDKDELDRVKSIIDSYGIDAIDLIGYDENGGFVKAMNHGLAYMWLRYPDTKYVCILNNDTIVARNWLRHMIYVMDANADAGVVGPYTTYGSKDQTMMWAMYTAEGPQIIDHRIMSDDDVDTIASQIESNGKHAKPVDHLSGFCMLTYSSLLKAVGGFDPRFGYGSGEEAYYRWLVKNQHNMNSYLAQNAFVWHYGHATFGVHPGINSKELWEANDKLFRELTNQ
jgi:GT2 family glycosyltransferase